MHRGNERSSGAGGGDISWAGDLPAQYDNALGLRESETATAETFEAKFPVVTGRTVQMIEFDREPPDRVALIDGMETGLELTAVHAGRQSPTAHGLRWAAPGQASRPGAAGGCRCSVALA
jgi:hypothetical protein